MLFLICGVSLGMTGKQRDSSAKFLYDIAKGIGFIAVVGGMVSGQLSL
jgi:hypothetical protein